MKGLLVGAAASIALGVLVLVHMADVGADVIVAVIEALTPNPVP
jgi:hypothetical protein